MHGLEYSKHMALLSSQGNNRFLILGSIGFIVIVGIAFSLIYTIGKQASFESRQQQLFTQREAGETLQQVRKIKFIKTGGDNDGEVMEINFDGTVNYFDKNGKLIRTGRRGFAEVKSLFKDFEDILNKNKPISGYNGYIIEIETQQGTTTINPGDTGGGSDLIDNLIDVIDNTLNPTPIPTAIPTPTPSSSPTSSPILPTPTPLPGGIPDYMTAPPFDCTDYYLRTGKYIKISDIYCGLE